MPCGQSWVSVLKSAIRKQYDFSQVDGKEGNEKEEESGKRGST